MATVLEEYTTEEHHSVVHFCWQKDVTFKCRISEVVVA
jgi:hypothetical protein